MNNPLVTVIVPVYNVQEYLVRCITSLINQTYRNIEIILVDDGSTDASGEMCDYYAQSDNRITVIHKENGGLADARNAAIDIMKGDYVTFVDSDDWIEKDYVEYLINLLINNNAEISISPFFKVYENQKEIGKYTETIDVVDNVEAIKLFLYQRKFTASAPCKMYRSDIFSSIRYPKGMYYEDMAVICQILDEVNKVVISNCPKYFYYQRENGIMHCEFNIRKMHRIKIAEEILGYISATHPELIGAAETRLFLASIQTYKDIPRKDIETKEYSEYVWKSIKKYRKKVVTNLEAKTTTRIMAATSYLGKVVFHILGDMYSMFV